MSLHFDFQQFLSAFFVLFAIIDIIGTMPVMLSLKRRGKKINPLKAAIMGFCAFMVFLFVGEAFLKLFGVDISSFAVAGSLIIFVMALEMVLDINIFKETEDSPKDSTFFPVVFPLIAGAGSLTTILSLRSQIFVFNIMLAVAANMFVVYWVLRFVKKLEAILGAGGVYMIKKFFGIILLAISVKLFTTNLTLIIEGFINR